MIVDEVRAALARVSKLFVISLAFLGLAAPVANAQDEEDQQSTAMQESDDEVEEVVVTGSRLKRDTYSSISPLQVISGQMGREIGLIDPGTILQESTAASGVQVDLTFSGFVLDNGPGATTIDLRGLGAGRTLLLINGRRVAPAGVEGAPVSVDTTLLPGALVQQYELLLDGASSVYGSDAVAGVANVILRRDFEGFEVEAFSSFASGQENNTGDQHRISASWGYSGDRGFFGIGAEYRDWERVNLSDREWTAGCNRDVEVTTEGEIRTFNYTDNENWGMRPDDCVSSGLVGRFQEIGTGALGSIYYTPGFSNTGIPNFSDNGLYSVPISFGADGYNDVTWVDYATNGREQFQSYIPDIQTYSAMAYGEYTLPGEANVTPYFEVLYARRESFQDAGAYQFFPWVPAEYAFSPCNPNGVNGVDCGLAHDSILDDPTYRAAFTDYYVSNFGCFGLPPSACLPESFGLYQGAIGAVTTRPIVNVRGDRTLVDVDVDQIRFVGGVRGDIPALNGVGSLDNWSWDFYAMQSESSGESTRPGIRGDRLDYAVGWFSPTRTPCEGGLDVSASLGTPYELQGDTAAGCVPVNMYAPSLYDPVVGGDFATQAERDYLFDTRDFDTDYKQTVFSLYANGDVFEMPGGTALFGIGAEYRIDEIDSMPDAVAEQGLFFGFFSDGGAIGEKWTEEYFAEMELPIFAGNPGMEELTVNFSTRYTKDEFYGSAWTYSGKLAYRPIESLLIRGTVGTSFRAPNLRENFLRDQTGFLGIFDPCSIPEDAWDDLTDTYIPENDTREPQVLANCFATGVDPTTFYNGGIQVFSTEIATGGTTDIREETSESWSAGLTWEQPFWSSFDLVFGATYYEIDITDEIIEPSAQFIVNDCYNDEQLDSPFCSRIIRDPNTSIFDIINSGFINRDQKKARGVDLNMSIDIPTSMFDRAVDIGFDFAFNRTLELRDVFLNDDGIATEDDDVGEFGVPEWKGRMAMRMDVGKWRGTWSTRYISSVEQDPDGIDDFSNVIDGGSSTCFGPAQGDVDCRDVGFADNYFVHDMSVYYRGDQWTLGAGMRNVFNEEPPQVNGTEVFAINNTPFGAGYDVFGRQIFLNVVFNTQ